MPKIICKEIISNTNSYRHYLIFMCKYTNNNNMNDSGGDDDKNAYITGAEVCIFMIVSTFHFMFQFYFY